MMSSSSLAPSSSSSSKPPPSKPPAAHNDQQEQQQQQQSSYMYHVKVRGDCTVVDNETFTLFGFEIMTSLTSWLVFRRYRELHKFFEATQVLGEDLSRTVALFPRKTLFGKTSKKTVEQRVKDLNSYFGAITAVCGEPGHQKLRQLVHDFLSAKDLCRYAFYNDIMMMRMMVNEHQMVVHRTDDLMGTPLHYAAAQGHEDMTKYLLDLGANPVAQDIFANTPLELARRRGHQTIVQLLIEASTGSAVQVPRGTYIPPQYQVDPYKRRFLVLVDGRAPEAAAVHDGVLKPVFGVCRIRYVTTVLRGTNECECASVIAEMDMDRFDGIICIGPDHLLTEVVNALGDRPDGINAIHTPVTAIPCGEHRNLATSLNVESATHMVMRIIRGTGLCRPLDLIQVELMDGSGDLTYAVFSVSWGLLRDPPPDGASMQIDPADLRDVLTADKHPAPERAVVKLESVTGVRQTLMRHSGSPCSRCCFACCGSSAEQDSTLSWSVSEIHAAPAPGPSAAQSFSDYTPLGTSFHDYVVSSYEQPRSQISSKASIMLGIDEDDMAAAATMTTVASASVSNGNNVGVGSNSNSSGRRNVRFSTLGRGTESAAVMAAVYGSAKKSSALPQQQQRRAYSFSSSSGSGQHRITPNQCSTETTVGDNGGDDDDDDDRLSSASSAVTVNESKWWTELLRDEFDGVVLQNLSHMCSELVAPYAHFSDGCMDLVLLRPTARGVNFREQIRQIGNVPNFSSGLSYSKVSKVSIHPTYARPDLQDYTFCIIDGTLRMNRDIIVSVRPGIATLMA